MWARTEKGLVNLAHVTDVQVEGYDDDYAAYRLIAKLPDSGTLILADRLSKDQSDALLFHIERWLGLSGLVHIPNMVRTIKAHSNGARS